MSKFTDIGVEKVGHVGTIEIQRPPLNFFDISLINQIADALEEFDRDIEIRSSVALTPSLKSSVARSRVCSPSS